jgi:hypothetical protein
VRFGTPLSVARGRTEPNVSVTHACAIVRRRCPDEGDVAPTEVLKRISRLDAMT